MEAVEQFKKTLSQLTFNSRPIIDALTAAAGSNVEVADQILDAITARIYQVKPIEKLFTLYLLDSICKTVNNPYNILIGDEVFKLFSHVYLLSDELVRGKLSNLFITWKQTKTRDKLPLFPINQLEKIQQFLDKARNNENERLIRIIDELVPTFETKLKNQYSDKLREKLEALKQLRNILKTSTLKKNELQSIESQLSTIKQQELGSPLPSNVIIKSPTKLPSSLPVAPSSLPSAPSSLPVPPSSLPSAPSLPKIPKTGPSLPAMPGSLPSMPGSLPSMPTSLPTIPHQSPVQELMELDNYEPDLQNGNTYNGNFDTPAFPTKVNEIFDSLINVGIITFEQDFKGPRTYDINYPKVINRSTDLMETIRNSQVPRNDYEKLKFNELSKFKIDNFQSFINNNNLSIQCKKLLYDSKNLKCLNCGKRFNNNELDKKKLHLDWHFRINKKFKSGSVQSRNWYLDEDEWVRFKDENLLEFQISENPIVSQPIVEEEIPYVVIPSTETNMNNKCLICREIIKGTFNDDLGEWCWVNCIVPPGETSPRIVHANCYNETKKRLGDDLNGIVKREKLT